jgi:tetratricopeptide (TPR) repeat protein
MAQRLHASREAARLLGRALELLEPLPRSPEREARELAILTSLLSPLANAEGFASPRLEEAQGRALEVAHRLGVDPPSQLLGSLAIASLCRDEFEAAQGFGERLLARGRTDGDDAVLVEAAYVLGIAAYWQGELEAARRHFQSAVAEYRPARRALHLLRYWLDPQVVCLSRLGNTLWFLGDPAAAERARDDALRLADQVGHAPTRSAALAFAALLAVEMEDTARLREYVAALESGPDQRDAWPTFVATGLLRSYLRVLDGDGDGEGGIAEIRSAVEAAGRAEHAPGLRAVVARLLLAACEARGDVPGRLDAADHMLRLGGAARLWEAEARRQRAECLAALGAPGTEVDRELEAAIAVARRQGARMLEGKAAAATHRLRTAATRSTEPYGVR